ncbi:hypothetical protein EW146_g7438, partial [Bondarzewia mesenterica]
MASPTEISLPPHLPYPIKIVQLHKSAPDTVKRGDRLLTYSFSVPVPDAAPELRFGTWDSPLDGTVHAWRVSQNDAISARRANATPVLSVSEQCKHEIQIGGLCAICGKDMTSFDYTGFSDASRASIQMTHSAHGPTVSLEEAQRIERESADHLLKARKLSLIVDLDQTIVHATVDPTVGEWIAEGEAWEARRAKRAETKRGSHDAVDSDGTVSDTEDEVNPNWEALMDVKKFRLGPESFGIVPGRSVSSKGKGKAFENQGCLYYVKPRPGWHEFLSSMATKYEMHVYTMGTRAYAEEVCAAIDPEGKFFGGRLLSRDESGSMTQKNLKRLFPVDTSMVVIIDDRADVWEWSPNLIKVIPYDFFVGIGDINSAFLPRVDAFSSVIPPPSPLMTTIPPNTPPSLALPLTSSETLVPPDIPPQRPTPSSASLDTGSGVVEQRPLAKKQEELQESEDEAEAEAEAEAAKEESPLTLEGGREGEGNASALEDAARPEEKSKKKETPSKEKHVRKALLRNDDVELQRVATLLDEVHKRFFDAYDRRPPDSHGRKHHGNAKKPSSTVPAFRPSRIPYDATQIIPRIRMETLKGVHIVFSSVIPLDTRPESTEIWRMANAFGATCHTELSSEVTHVVAAK